MEQDFNVGRMRAAAIAKAFGVDIEKGRHGVYEDNAENRRLNRVGQEYGHKAEEKQSAGKQPKQGEQTEQERKTSAATMESAAQGASDGALKRAAADPKAPDDVKAAAKKELENRGVEFRGGVKKDERGKFKSPLASEEERKLNKEFQHHFRRITRRGNTNDDWDAFNKFFLDNSSNTNAYYDLDKMRRFRDFVKNKEKEGISWDLKYSIEDALDAIDNLIEREKNFRAGNFTNKDAYAKKHKDEDLKKEKERLEKEYKLSASDKKRLDEAMSPDENHNPFDDWQGGNAWLFLHKERFPKFNTAWDGEKTEEKTVTLLNKDKIIFKKTGKMLDRENSWDADFDYSISIKKPDSDKPEVLVSGRFEEREEKEEETGNAYDFESELRDKAFFKYFGIKDYVKKPQETKEQKQARIEKEWKQKQAKRLQEALDSVKDTLRIHTDGNGTNYFWGNEDNVYSSRKNPLKEKITNIDDIYSYGENSPVGRSWFNVAKKVK